MDRTSLMWNNLSLSDFKKQLISKERSQQQVLAESVRIGSYFAWSFIMLGTLAFILNVTILFVLLIRRRKAFKAVFYSLIFNFCLIDTLKALCLMAYAWRLLRASRQLGYRLDQYLVLAFRFCNLATIINLLTITLNEFIFIKYPFKYNRYVKRKVVYALIVANWTLCLAFTIGSSLAKERSSRGMYVRTDFSTSSSSTSNSSLAFPYDKNSPSRSDMTKVNEQQQILKMGRGSNSDAKTLYVFAFMLSFFCLVCLVVVIICYVSFIRVIRAIKIQDTKLYLDANYQGQVLATKRRTSSAEETATVTRKHYSNRQNSTHIDVMVAKSSDDNRLVKQLLKRNKYAIVIGSVIIAYAMFLISYLTIQIFQYMLITRTDGEGDLGSLQMLTKNSYVVRWSLQVIVGVHSILQPLCYLRMRELRRGILHVLCACFYGGAAAAFRGDNMAYYTDQASGTLPAAAEIGRQSRGSRESRHSTANFSSTMSAKRKWSSRRQCDGAKRRIFKPPFRLPGSLRRSKMNQANDNLKLNATAPILLTNGQSSKDQNSIYNVDACVTFKNQGSTIEDESVAVTTPSGSTLPRPVQIIRFLNEDFHDIDETTDNDD